MLLPHNVLGTARANTFFFLIEIIQTKIKENLDIDIKAKVSPKKQFYAYSYSLRKVYP